MYIKIDQIDIDRFHRTGCYHQAKKARPNIAKFAADDVRGLCYTQSGNLKVNRQYFGNHYNKKN